MKWEKRGMIYQAPFDGTWKDNSALTPTPYVRKSGEIRVFCGFRDRNGISRIGYVDLNPYSPNKIIKVSEKPVLDIGKPGNFDDNGIILGDVIRINDKLHIYYIGFQLVNKVKFLAFTGLAISYDDGDTFERYQETPILDRKAGCNFINALHTILKIDNTYKCWLGAGNDWKTINDNKYPIYNIKQIETIDGINFNTKPKDCISFVNEGEYRVGRPRVIKMEDHYEMYFTWGDIKGNYLMGFAESSNAKDWKRDDKKLHFPPSNNGWDSKWVSYGAPLKVNQKMLMFYNGNNMGKEGFGLAERIN
jgi:predicted GH43/DUF377 family glycosyl hydrolase